MSQENPEATQLIDQMEANDRANALIRLQDQLVDAGMTPGGAARAAEGMSHGVIPNELVDGASAGSKVLAGGEQAFNRTGESLPTGKHWVPEVNTYSPEDVEALKRIGGKLGWVGNVVDAGVGLYEIQQGAAPGEVVAKTGGGIAGAWAVGAAGAEIGAAGGPPGAFFGALIGGGLGAWGGEEFGERAYKWLTG